MRKIIQAASLIIALLPSVTLAQDFDAGLQAYKAGNYETALKEWRPLAEQGIAEAQYNLGQMYYNGKGVPQDYTEAAKWFRLAAEQGYAEAQNNLGLMYARGEGVPQDYVLAHMWSNISAANGYKSAQKTRGKVAAKMAPSDITKAQ